MELVIFIGLQASGKSTFYHERFARTHVHVSKDN
jgi:predicted kinase